MTVTGVSGSWESLPEARAEGLRPRKVPASGTRGGSSGGGQGASSLSFQAVLSRLGGGSPPPRNDAEGRALRLAWAARELETFLVQEVWRSMRKTLPQGGLLSQGPGSQMFEEMLDEERARIMASTGTLGLAALIYERLLPLVEAGDAPTGSRGGRA